MLRQVVAAEEITRNTKMEASTRASLEQMDAAAFRARRELEQNLKTWTATDLIDWWNRWHLSAGHKRLGRTLVDLKKLLK
jgi:hypothetical protein